jgi:hypothetical protein
VRPSRVRRRPTGWLQSDAAIALLPTLLRPSLTRVPHGRLGTDGDTAGDGGAAGIAIQIKNLPWRSFAGEENKIEG